MTPQPAQVVHLIPDLSVGGAQMALLRLLSTAEVSPWSHAVVSMQDEGSIGRRVRNMGFPVYALDLRRGRIPVTGVVRLVGTLKALGPKIIHCWMYHANLAGLVANLLLAEKARVLWAIHAGRSTLSRDKALTRLVIKANALLSGYPDAIVNVSSRSAWIHEKQFGFATDRQTVIPNGFDAQHFHPRCSSRKFLRQLVGLNPDAIVIGSVGRYHPIKGYELLLRAAADIFQKMKNCSLVLVGTELTPDNDHLVGLARSLGIADRVRFLGAREDINKIMPGFDIFCLPSYSEALPTVVGEAMCCAVPCVVTDVGDARQLLHDGGLVVESNAPSLLAEGLLKLLTMTADERRRLGNIGRKRIEAEYSLNRMGQSYARLYQTLGPNKSAH